MKLADKLNSTYTIIIGEDEMKNNEFTIRNMLNGSQQSINFDNIKALLEL
ncbi:MAG: His/Gly/Thr/Pro-type tRNA ligase C-terminal domain-containing protein [Candidatus Cloacimonetes bacterium]|nr:His/Gly/Thr/Pro-type tRNA ligase C-terminal domain-containing protein [Candidatus Cloacimonadota bacterium]